MLKFKHLPGLAIAASIAAVAFVVEYLIKNNTAGVVSPLVIAVVLGALISNLGLLPDECRVGLGFAARNLLRLGIVLLGLQLSFSQVRELGAPGLVLVIVVVAATFTGTQWLGKKMGLSPGLSLLVATGFSICGASAIAAMRPVSDADDDDMAYAIALVTICGTLAIFLLPAIGEIIGFSGAQFGSWVGASVHDVAQTVATAASGNDDAQDAAIVVKLTRVMLLAPLVAAVSFTLRRKLSHTNITDSNTQKAKLPPIVPLFIIGFIAAISINSSFNLPSELVSNVKWLEKSLLACALAGLGAGVDIKKLRRVGTRPLALGLISWMLIATLSAIGVGILNIS
ncbi:MAG: putative sulfate exporter family transporter [Ilumatobacteraceae bacterium]|nr:putative sulfate exporter family transporter [Ilumatobacteraceae bacterium]